MSNADEALPLSHTHTVLQPQNHPLKQQTHRLLSSSRATDTQTTGFSLFKVLLVLLKTGGKLTAGTLLFMSCNPCLIASNPLRRLNSVPSPVPQPPSGGGRGCSESTTWNCDVKKRKKWKTLGLRLSHSEVGLDPHHTWCQVGWIFSLLVHRACPSPVVLNGHHIIILHNSSLKACWEDQVR